MRRPFNTPATWLWGGVYLLAMVLVVVTLLNLRRDTLDSMDNAQARHAWALHRADAKAHSGREGPVQRQVPPSVEPPALVLMRDYFGIMLAAALVFSTALFAMLVLVVKGTLWRAPGNSPPFQGGAGGG
ncbi:MAG: hypothetical protein K8T25_04935 [Planctomycetia bacterium]|nr:hypothetical protein [Planctomycetia bacterium]